MIEPNTDKSVIDWGTIKDSGLLKARSGDYVLYKVDYLLDNLAREIYLLEHYKKYKEELNNEQRGNNYGYDMRNDNLNSDHREG